MFKDHFSSQSKGYAEFRPAYPEGLFAYLAGLTPARQLAWDCATGTGQAAGSLAEHFERVIATDASERQISNAPPHDRIDYRVEPAEATDIGSGTLDLIVVAQALHWLDLGAFYGEARRVLKPEGVIAVWCYDLLRIAPELDAIVGHLYRDLVGDDWPAERRLVEDGYRSLRFPFDEIRPPSFRMSASWSLGQLIGYLGTWSAVRRFEQRTGKDPIGIIAGSLQAAWAEPDTRRRVEWSLALRVGRHSQSLDRRHASIPSRPLPWHGCA